MTATTLDRPTELLPVSTTADNPLHLSPQAHGLFKVLHRYLLSNVLSTAELEPNYMCVYSDEDPRFQTVPAR
jgi:hypothetical protein